MTGSWHSLRGIDDCTLTLQVGGLDTGPHIIIDEGGGVGWRCFG